MAKRKDIMLAYPAEERRIKALGTKFFIQPKLRGIRAWVRWTPAGFPQLISSQGNEFQKLPHINAALWGLAQSLRLTPCFDGELYRHGMPFREISSRVKRETQGHPDAASIQLHIFDEKRLLTPQLERFRDLLYTCNSFLGSPHSPLQRVPIQNLSEGDDPARYLARYIKDGYEGIIFRSRNGLYEEKRSTNLLKFKPTRSDTYEIVGLEQGKGWCIDRLGAFLVKGSDGTVFAVGSGSALTAEGRKRYWELGDSLIGKQLLVKHEKIKTVGNIPLCAVACEVLEIEEV